MASASSPQYHHFIPQFLLRNFSHPYRPPKKSGQKSKQSKKKFEHGLHRGDLVIRNADLSADPAIICEKPVKRILGNTDMYRDTSRPTAEQHHVEQMLSKLESSASIIVRKITKAFEQKEGGLWLTRTERNAIRKFFFILKYRGSTFHQRFYHERQETYLANDRELLYEYMQDKGYTRPIDVWFHNLKTIMELEMDPEKQWIHELPKKMFPDDAQWFMCHVEMSYMAICTPAEATDEFILTDNCFNVFEGPNCYATDEVTGKVEGVSYAPLHDFAPISPKLMIVFRNFIMPVPEEDANPAMKECRDKFRFLTLGKDFAGPVKSLLEDLPISKARNNYSQVMNGRTQLLDGEDGRHRKDDKFCFKFFPIETGDVLLINSIFLDNAQSCTSLVFESRAAFIRTLEGFLTDDCSYQKFVPPGDDDPRLLLFRKLAALLKDLGSEREPVWKQRPFPAIPDYEAWRRSKVIKRLMAKHLQKLDDQGKTSDTMKIYKELGGHSETFVYDMEQAGLMWKMRIKIDVWSQGVDEYLRQRNRDLLIDAYLRLPPSRVWFFVKHLRNAFLNHQAKSMGRIEVEEGVHVSAKENFDGPEDVIARASHVIERHQIAKLMYKAVLNDIERRKEVASTAFASKDRIGCNLWAKYKTTFEVPGYICDCGIPEIETLADLTQLKVMPRIPFLDDRDAFELLIRRTVRSMFFEMLADKVEYYLLKELEEVFFNIVYQIPNLHMM
ncbi:hypothetical protein B0J13DRAFT_517531 [Dactylonectria estremocensis]|uniref:DUF4238 domain-containing protein n=1 Tax=Dactylonectria estremocensis TaxID=1079267 RepID=A0A9P9FJK6_9HYPO|nr:hypothetical protein B0J13DRAFT_517531 [Dactylonectria estremocensis]